MTQSVKKSITKAKLWLVAGQFQMTNRLRKFPDFLAVSAFSCVAAFLFGMFMTACQSTPPMQMNIDDKGQMQIVPATTTTTTQVVKGVALDWEKNHPEKVAWSQALRGQIQSHLPDFKKAKWDSFCPKASSLTDAQTIDMLSTFAVGVALYESSYNAKTVYHEPAPLNIDSVGLFQLSYEDHMKWCSMDKAKGNLADPVVNIQCAIGMMAHLVSQDEIVTTTQKPWKGIARYWSTVRPPKLAKIQSIVKGLPFCK